MNTICRYCLEAIKLYKKRFILCILLMLMLSAISALVPFVLRGYISSVSKRTDFVAFAIGIAAFMLSCVQWKA